MSLVRESSRRTFLRGSGVGVALPLLESLLPRSAQAQAAATPRRLLYWFIPNGVISKQWVPTAPGRLSAAALPPSLKPLADEGVVDDVSILSGIDNLCADV